MLPKGTAQKVTVYLNEDTRSHQTPLYQAIMDFLFHKGVSGATLMRPHSGFGPHRRVHSQSMEATMEHLPVRIEFVETVEKVNRLMPLLYDMVTDGLIEVQDTFIVKAASLEQPEAAALKIRHREQARGKMLRVFLGEGDRWEGEPLYDAIVKRLRMLEIAGATVERGILGYGAKGKTHKDSFLHRSRDLPIVISVIDTGERIERAIAAVEEMMDDGLIVISEVETIRLVHEVSGEHVHDAG